VTARPGRSGGVGLGDDGLEAFDEREVTVGFVVPAACLGVFGELAGVGALGRQHGEHGGRRCAGCGEGLAASLVALDGAIDGRLRDGEELLEVADGVLAGAVELDEVRPPGWG
jgi:hypothetical protein